MAAGLKDVAQVLRLPLVHLAEHPLGQDFRESEDGVQRCAQLVRHVGEELRLVLAGDLKPLALLRDLSEQPCVLDGDDGLIGEGLQQGDLLVGEGSDLPAPRREDPDQVPLAKHGDGEDGAHVFVLVEIAGPRRELRIVEQIGHVNGAALERSEAGRRLTAGARTRVPQMLGEARCGAAARRRRQKLAVVDEEGRDVRLAQPGDALEDDVAHGWERGWRARDYPQDLARRRLLLQGLRQSLLEVADPRDSLRRRVVNERSLGFRLTLLGLCTATHQALLASRSVAINDRLCEGARVSKPDGARAFSIEGTR